MGKEQLKRQKRAAHNLALFRGSPQEKKTDRQVGQVRQNAMHLDGHSNMRQPLGLSNTYAAPPQDHHAVPKGWVNDRIANHDSEHYDAFYVKSTVDSLINWGNLNDRPTNTGYALDGAYDHRHSISSTTFIQRSEEERERMLDDRTDLQYLYDSDGLTYEEAVQARNTLNLLSLLMDYDGLDAYERERRFKDPAWHEWTIDYKRTYGVDEYAEEARAEFVYHHGVRMDPKLGIVRGGS